MEIRLNRAAWQYDPGEQLGPSGGFGRVYRGVGEEGVPVAVKRLHLTASDAAHRELRIAEELAGAPYGNILVPLDSGQDAEDEAYYVVMPLADCSLEGYLQDGRGKLTEEEAVEVLSQVAKGLEEAAGLVHRDLKPGNILRHDGRWKIADFGIARFVEDSTSMQTLKEFLTPAYAAPEQWTFQQVSKATDLYALGCVGHTLLTGAPPFTGSPQELKEEHLHAPPPLVEGVAPQLGSLLTMLLRKHPEARPSLGRTRHILESLPTDRRHNGTLSALAEKGRVLAAEAAEEEARIRREQTQEQAELSLAQEGLGLLKEIALGLIDEVEDHIPTCRPVRGPDSWRAEIPGKADLRIGVNHAGPLHTFRVGWKVYAGGAILVEQAGPTPYQWAANLWYGRTDSDGDCRWFEMGYAGGGLRIGGGWIPFSTNIQKAMQADGSGSQTLRLAYPDPIFIDDEDEVAFRERWLRILLAALEGRLQRPRYTPFDPRTLFPAG